MRSARFAAEALDTLDHVRLSQADAVGPTTRAAACYGVQSGREQDQPGPLLPVARVAESGQQSDRVRRDGDDHCGGKARPVPRGSLAHNRQHLRRRRRYSSSSYSTSSLSPSEDDDDPCSSSHNHPYVRIQQLMSDGCVANICYRSLVGAPFIPTAATKACFSHMTSLFTRH